MRFTLDLPSPFRRQEILAFHGRDPARLAEDCDANRIRKAFLLDGIPVEIDISLEDSQARCRAKTDAPLPKETRQQLPSIAAGLLGLNHDVSVFEKIARQDALLGPLIKRQLGLRIPQTATPFEALTWAIIGQQINLTFAVTLRRTLIQLAGREHSGGLWCYPDAASVSPLKLEDFASRKFTRAKAETLLRVTELTASGQLTLSPERPATEMAEELLKIKGIGPWTVNYVLLRGLGCPDCSLHGDAGVKAALRRLTGAAPTTEEAYGLLERYAPHRSWAAAHLWASL
jgi:DNA-3-methyladenine glycosylase II